MGSCRSWQNEGFGFYIHGDFGGLTWGVENWDPNIQLSPLKGGNPQWKSRLGKKKSFHQPIKHKRTSWVSPWDLEAIESLPWEFITKGVPSFKFGVQIYTICIVSEAQIKWTNNVVQGSLFPWGILGRSKHRSSLERHPGTSHLDSY